MKPVPDDLLLRQLHWRYATKQFDPTRKIAPQDWATLESAVVLSPSSYGLQPWKLLVITNPELRKKLQVAAYGQPQIVDASHLVVFAGKKNVDTAHVDHLIAETARQRGTTVESLQTYRNTIVGSLQRPPEVLQAWAARQAYLALGVFLTSAAMLGIDACPMEGFSPAQFDEILNLEPQGYATAVIATAGYRSANDKYAQLPKVRFPKSELITTLA